MGANFWETENEDLDFYYSCHEKIISKKSGRKLERDHRGIFVMGMSDDSRSAFNSEDESESTFRAISLPNLSWDQALSDSINSSQLEETKGMESIAQEDMNLRQSRFEYKWVTPVLDSSDT